MEIKHVRGVPTIKKLHAYVLRFGKLQNTYDFIWWADVQFFSRSYALNNVKDEMVFYKA